MLGSTDTNVLWSSVHTRDAICIEQDVVNGTNAISTAFVSHDTKSLVRYAIKTRSQPHLVMPTINGVPNHDVSEPCATTELSLSGRFMVWRYFRRKKPCRRGAADVERREERRPAPATLSDKERAVCDAEHRVTASGTDGRCSPCPSPPHGMSARSRRCPSGRPSSCRSRHHD